MVFHDVDISYWFDYEDISYSFIYLIVKSFLSNWLWRVDDFIIEYDLSIEEFKDFLIGFELWIY